MHYAYQMRRFTIVAPHVRNDGSMSGYPAALRDALLTEGFDGWTETETHGSWRGKREAGVTFEILLPVADAISSVQPPEMRARVVSWQGDRYTVSALVNELRIIARRVMPDQEAIQVTLEPGTVMVWEA